MSDGPDYNELGEVLDHLARTRNVRGPYVIARHIKQKTGKGPSGSAWRQILTGETKRPTLATIKLFTEAFELSEEERAELATVYTFRGLVAA